MTFRNTIKTASTVIAAYSAMVAGQKLSADADLKKHAWRYHSSRLYPGLLNNRHYYHNPDLIAQLKLQFPATRAALSAITTVSPHQQVTPVLTHDVISLLPVKQDKHYDTIAIGGAWALMRAYAETQAGKRVLYIDSEQPGVHQGSAHHGEFLPEAMIIKQSIPTLLNQTLRRLVMPRTYLNPGNDTCFIDGRAWLASLLLAPRSIGSGLQLLKQHQDTTVPTLDEATQAVSSSQRCLLQINAACNIFYPQQGAILFYDSAEDQQRLRAQGALPLTPAQLLKLGFDAAHPQALYWPDSFFFRPDFTARIKQQLRQLGANVIPGIVTKIYDNKQQQQVVVKQGSHTELYQASTVYRSLGHSQTMLPAISAAGVQHIVALKTTQPVHAFVAHHVHFIPQQQRVTPDGSYYCWAILAAGAGIEPRPVDQVSTEFDAINSFFALSTLITHLGDNLQQLEVAQARGCRRPVGPRFFPQQQDGSFLLADAKGLILSGYFNSNPG